MNIYGVRIGINMTEPPTVIVDADAIIAQANPEDKHHQTATTITQSLIKINAQVIYPVTAVTEATAYVQRVLNSTASAYEMTGVFTDPNVHVAEVNQETLISALEYYSPKTSKKNTLFDCIVAVIADKYQADAIFSFDKFYKKKGFKLATDLKFTNKD